MGNKAEKMMRETGTRLEQLRIALDIRTIRAFAAEIGVPEDRYQKWAKGKVMIPVLSAQVLVDRYGITADWLYYGKPGAMPHDLYQRLHRPPAA